MLSAQMEHLLNLEDVPRPGVCAALNNEANKISVLLIRQDLAAFQTSLALRLLTKE
jgi:hypothetical protein